MATIGELTAEMDGLEEAALRILGSPGMTAIERRLALERLLGRYGALEAYRRGLAAYLSRMRRGNSWAAEDPETVIREVLASPEFGLLRLVVFAILLAVVYNGGPRANLVPLGLIGALTVPAPVPAW